MKKGLKVDESGSCDCRCTRPSADEWRPQRRITSVFYKFILITGSRGATRKLAICLHCRSLGLHTHLQEKRVPHTLLSPLSVNAEGCLTPERPAFRNDIPKLSPLVCRRLLYIDGVERKSSGERPFKIRRDVTRNGVLFGYRWASELHSILVLVTTAGGERGSAGLWNSSNAVDQERRDLTAQISYCRCLM